jgi:hypothetical protein
MASKKQFKKGAKGKSALSPDKKNDSESKKINDDNTERALIRKILEKIVGESLLIHL